MPLSELVYRLAKGNCDSSSQEINTACLTDRSLGLENDFVELVWENGQVQSTRARKIEGSKEAQYQTSKIMDKDTSRLGMESKMGRFEAMDTVRDEVPMSVPSVEMGLNQDNDISSWLNCPIDDSLQQDYCHELFPELGVTVNAHTDNRFASLDTRSSGKQSVRDSQTVSVNNKSSLEQGRMTRVSSAQNGDANWPRTSGHQLYSSSVQQFQTSFPYFSSRVSGNNRESTNNSNVLSSSRNPIRTSPSGCGFASTKAELSTSNSSLMNFSHFSRPAALAKANFQHIGTRAASGKSSLERFGSKDKGSIASSNEPAESVLIDTFNGLQEEMSSHCHPPMIAFTADAQPMDSEPTEKTFPLKQPEVLDRKSDSKNEKNYYRFAESETKGLVDGEKTADPVVASSSVCSVSSVDRVSDEPTQNLQRKQRENEESEGPSEDIEEESAGGKKSIPARRGTGVKRTRAAEVHNLSERRRRDRINEKMRALQELIPNCNKVDKASMLDEAIEYLKTLQLQVQIMSMGAGLYMPSMMLPPVVPRMHMSQFSSMGVGMGMGFGLGMPDMTGGSPGCPMMPVPPMQGAHFAGPPMSGPSALYGLGGSNLQMFGLSGQGHSVPYPCAPGVPMPGGPLLRPTLGLNAESMTGAVNTLKSASVTSSKDNVNSQPMQNSADNSSMNQMSQGQATNECIEHSALVQSSVQVSKINENGASRTTDGNDNVPCEVAN